MDEVEAIATMRFVGATSVRAFAGELRVGGLQRADGRGDKASLTAPATAAQTCSCALAHDAPHSGPSHCASSARHHTGSGHLSLTSDA